MEVNISHKCRQEILTTADLAHPNLFNNAVNEIIHLMKMVSCVKPTNFFFKLEISHFSTLSSSIFLLQNFARDYWSSIYFLKFKEEEASERSSSLEMDPQIGGGNFSPRLSAVQVSDDPFHQNHHLPRSLDYNEDPSWVRG